MRFGYFGPMTSSRDANGRSDGKITMNSSKTEALNQKVSLHVSHYAIYGSVKRCSLAYPHKHTHLHG